MQHWVCKGNPTLNNWDKMLVPGNTEKWHTRKVPKLLASGDRLFFWESFPGLRLIGIGEVVDPSAGRDKNGDDLFELRYLTRRLGDSPTLQELRGVPSLRGATFLKSGPAAVLSSLFPQQAKTLFELVSRRNRSFNLEKIWPDLSNEPVPEVLPDLDVGYGSVAEGEKRLRAHLMRERNRAIVVKKRDSVLRLFGRLACEVCEFDFAKNYGILGEGFCEVHHKLPLSEADGPIKTKLEDLAIVCSNCHRMIHRTNPPKDLDEMKSLIARSRS